MGFNEINHKIDMKVKKDYQVIISPLLQSMLGFRQAIFRGVCFRLGSTHPPTRPNAFVVLTPCKSEPSTRLHYS
jgi:hypothetical protein